MIQFNLIEPVLFTALGMVAGHFAFQAIKDFVNNTMNAMANVDKTAEYLGLSTASLQELRFAAKKTSYRPQSNGAGETFVKTFKRDYIYLNDVASADGVMEQLRYWFEDHNYNAPHGA